MFHCIQVKFKVKYLSISESITYLFSIYFFLKKRKKKRYKYEDKLGSKKIAVVPRQWRHKCLLVFLNAYRNNPQAHGIIIVALYPEVFRVSYFPREMEVNLLSSSSKDNPRVELMVEMDSFGLESKDR